MKPLALALLLLVPAAPAASFEGFDVSLSSGTRVVDLPWGRVKLTGPGEMTVSRDGIRLRLGRLLLALPKVGPRGFAVRTPHAVAAVRGTEFYVDAQPRSTYVCACEGKLAVGKTPISATRAKRHSARRFERGRLVDPEPGMLGHADDEFPPLRAR